MSIPRLAIQRPVTMFMISAVIMLLGGISLMRLPVDLLPDITYPRSRCASAATRASDRSRSRSWSPGRSSRRWRRCPPSSAINRPRRRVRARCACTSPGAATSTRRWTTCARASTGCAAVCRRTPDRPGIQKFDASSQPIMGIGVEGDYDRVTLREMAEQTLVAAARARARRRGRDGQRRPAPADSRRAVEGKDHGARPVGRPRRQRAPDGKPEHSARRDRRRRHDLPAPQPGPVPESGPDPRPRRAHEDGVPVYLKDIAEVKDTTEDLPLVPAHQRQARRAPAGHEAVGQEHRRDRHRDPRGGRAHQPRGAGRPHDGARRPARIHRAVDRRGEGST